MPAFLKDVSLFQGTGERDERTDTGGILGKI